jgi:hypothetical protein
MSTTDFDYYGICPCGEYRERAWRGNHFFISAEVCPKCGTHKNKWSIKISRWVYTQKLLKPSTWGKGYWENKE